MANYDQDLMDIVNQMLKDAEAERKAEASLPKTPVRESPWKFEGIRLVVSNQECLNCGSVSTHSHGFVRCYTHKHTPDKTWDTQLEQASHEELPSPFLGMKHLAAHTIFGCPNCAPFGDQL